jgi:hypothetical protein
MRRIPAWAWVLLLGAVLFLPRLGAHGLWDPYEIRFADTARELAQGKKAVSLASPPLSSIVAAAGVKLFGTGELAGRLPEALCGILGLLAIYYAASGLLSRRAAWVASLVAATTPLYLLQSRSMTSDIAACGAMSLMLGGLGRFAFSKRPLELVLGAVGAALSVLGAGGLCGVLPALLALAALALCARLAGPREAVVPALIAAGVAVLAGGWLLSLTDHPGAVMLGGTVRHGASTTTFEETLRLLGFGFFPASPAAALAAGVLIARGGSAAQASPEGARRTAQHVYLIAFAAAAVAAYGLANDRVNLELRFPALGALALLCGALFDEILREDEPHPMLGAAIALGVLLLARDCFLYTEDFATANIREAVRWPTEVKLGNPVLALSVVTACAIGVALAHARLRRAGFGLAQGGAIALGLVNAQVATPALSAHFSFKDVFTRYHELAQGKGPLRGYHVSGHGISYYAGGKLEELATAQAVADYLKGAGTSCVYALVPNEELGSLDQQLRAAGARFYVVDVSSSRFYLLSSCLQPGERDRNPLRNYVDPTPPNPPPRRVVHANWENKVELLGVDLPDTVSRLTDGKFAITLYFHVKDKLPAGYKVFIHFDGPGNRFNGDHVPADGRFPTQFWSPGDYISDRFVVPVPLMTTPAGTYTIWAGFFLGDNRLKLESGSAAEPNGTNRVPLGTMIVR